MDLLIDEVGEIWLNGSVALRRRLDPSAAVRDLADHAVRSHGFIRVRRGDGTIRLALSAGRFGFPTLESAVRLVLTGGWRRLVIEHADRLPSFEIYGRLEDAVARLKDLGAPSPLLARRERFSTQELSLDRLAESGQEALGGLLRLWRARQGELTPERLLAEMPEALKPRATVSRMIAVATPRSRALVEHMGAGFRVFDACWALGAVGRDLEEQPDPAHGALSARAYHEVVREGLPRLEAVDAVIAVPNRPVRRSRYDRLLLPFRARGELFVCGASVLRASYALDAPSVAPSVDSGTPAPVAATQASGS